MVKRLCPALLLSGLTAAGVFAQEPAASGAALPAEVTFTEHVASVIFENCTCCHRPGEIGPFPLITYRDVRKRARMIHRVTERRYMPPWHPEPGWGEFRDSRRMSDGDIALIRRWVETGKKEGPKQKLPPVPGFTDGWQLGKPDLVVEMPQAFRVPASGPDIYRNFAIPLDLPHDKWVTAIEVRPSARTVLHHTLFFLDDSGRARRLDVSGGKPGFRGMNRWSGQLGGWAVGATPRKLPLGLAYPVPILSDLILSSHFHPSGKVESEKTKIGLHFARTQPKRTLLGFQVPPRYGAMMGIDIPPGEAAYTVEDTFRVPADIELVGAWGHAHYVCKSMQSVAKLPDGREEKLFRIADWDFEWQGQYHYEEPVPLPQGTEITTTIVYDNSARNPQNPFDPPRRIRWGLQSTDEMGSVIFLCVTRNEKDVRKFKRGVSEERRRSALRHGGRVRRSATERIVESIMRLDRNGDGKIQTAEIPDRYRRWVGRLDRNGDGELDKKEIEALGGGRR